MFSSLSKDIVIIIIITNCHKEYFTDCDICFLKLKKKITGLFSLKDCLLYCVENITNLGENGLVEIRISKNLLQITPFH